MSCAIGAVDLARGLPMSRWIGGISFGPESIKAMGQAFDQVWALIAGYFGGGPEEIEIARLRLAEAVLSAATEGSTDVAKLKAGALHTMLLDYRSAVQPEVKKALGALNGHSCRAHPFWSRPVRDPAPSTG